MIRPWIELVRSTLRYGWRVGIANFRFELGAWIGGFEHCDTYTDDEIVDDHRHTVVQEAAKEQALTS
jgi:hypothetical protein